MKRTLLVCVAVLLVGCSGVAILPAKITYTYPLLDDLQCYQPAGRGAVAVQDNGTLRLVLPEFSKTQRVPKQIVFDTVTQDGVIWTQSKDDPDLKTRFMLAPEPATCTNGRSFNLPAGLLLVEFPPKPELYGELAGKQIWLTSTAGAGEIFVLRGIYYKSDATLVDRVAR